MGVRTVQRIFVTPCEIPGLAVSIVKGKAVLATPLDETDADATNVSNANIECSVTIYSHV